MDIVIDIYTLFSIYLENSGYILLCIKTKKELQILKTIPVRPIYISHMKVKLNFFIKIGVRKQLFCFKSEVWVSS